MFKKGGYVLWSSSLSGRSDSRVISSIDDIVSSPVIVGQNAYAADGSGKVVSLKIENGERKWTAPYGSSGNFWIAGKSLFFISDIIEHKLSLKSQLPFQHLDSLTHVQ